MGNGGIELKLYNYPYGANIKLCFKITEHGGLKK
jgi:hypothetical protein